MLVSTTSFSELCTRLSGWKTEREDETAREIFPSHEEAGRNARAPPFALAATPVPRSIKSWVCIILDSTPRISQHPTLYALTRRTLSSYFRGVGKGWMALMFIAGRARFANVFSFFYCH